MGIVTQTALGFIVFTIGNEFRLSQRKAMGSSAIIIGILQAVITTIVVDIVSIALHLCFPEIISIPCAITLGAIASATAPAATMMVVLQYKADGPLTRLLMLVVAIDDACKNEQQCVQGLPVGIGRHRCDPALFRNHSHGGRFR